MKQEVVKNMARTRKTELCTLANLEEVDDALRTMGDYDRRIEAINADMEAKINMIREEAAAMIQPLNDARKGLFTQVGLYAKGRTSDFHKVRTKVLNFGEFGFRRSTTLKCPSTTDGIAEVLERLRERDMNDCIKVVPDAINKVALKAYDKDAVEGVGCELIEKDTFFAEPKRETVAEEVG